MRIEYQEIVIRNIEKKDCEKLATWWNDGKVMDHCGFPKGLGIKAEEIENKIKTDSDDTKRRMVIEYRGKLIGECNYDRDLDKAEIGIKICDFDYQNKGLGRIILSMMIERLFLEGVKQIYLSTDLENKRAQHIYELLGFKKVKVDLDSWSDQLGRLRSAVTYNLFETDFKNYK